jgi:Na+-transporting NADH:ubiquinone oxidoreductase subunit C
MVVLVAAALAVASIGLKPYQESNIRIEKMRNILQSINVAVEPKQAEEQYKKLITGSFVVNNKGEQVAGTDAFEVDLYNELKKDPEDRHWPVFVAKTEKGEKLFIFPMRGKGLWGPVWGYISLKEDLNTVAGSMFDHKSETPGLGAEINTDDFQKQFIGKKIFDDNNRFTSILVKKGGAQPGDLHAVDAISGGTITSNGVTNMIRDCLKEYTAFFESERK